MPTAYRARVAGSRRAAGNRAARSRTRRWPLPPRVTGRQRAADRTGGLRRRGDHRAFRGRRTRNRSCALPAPFVPSQAWSGHAARASVPRRSLGTTWSPNNQSSTRGAPLRLATAGLLAPSQPGPAEMGLGAAPSQAQILPRWRRQVRTRVVSNLGDDLPNRVDHGLWRLIRNHVIASGDNAVLSPCRSSGEFLLQLNPIVLDLWQGVSSDASRIGESSACRQDDCREIAQIGVAQLPIVLAPRVLLNRCGHGARSPSQTRESFPLFNGHAWRRRI